jgi:hypothetical protein
MTIFAFRRSSPALDRRRHRSEKEAFIMTATRHEVSRDACHGEAQPQNSGGAKRRRWKNPHDNHITAAMDLECTQCHQGHKADAPLCHQCHEGMKFEKKKQQ